MLDRVQEKVGELQKLVQRVMNGLLAVANLLATRKVRVSTFSGRILSPQDFLSYKTTNHI